MGSGKKTVLTLFFLALMIFLVGLGGLWAGSTAEEEESSPTAVKRVTGHDYDTATGEYYLVTAADEKLYLADGARLHLKKGTVTLGAFPFPSVVRVTFEDEPDESGVRKVEEVVRLPE